MQLTWIDFAFWFTSPALQTVLLVLLWRRGLRREFPAFVNYTAFEIISHVLMFVAWRSSEAVYFYAYWTTSACGILLAFLVIREVFLEAFRPFEALRELGTILFRWSGLVLLLVAAATVAISPHGRATNEIVFAGITTLERSIRVMQCGLVLFMMLFSSYLGLTKRHFLFGIALGFGIYSSVHMLVLTARTFPGLVSGALASRLSAAAYVTAVLIWTGFALLPVAARRKFEVLPQSDRWNHALAGVLELPESEGFLPSMERTVERLLQQQHQTDR